MYPELQKELETFERRTPKSAEAHKRNLKRLPLGVASNYRAYDPYPIFVKEGQGSHFRDLDGNDYLDHNLCFGALMAGHCHPAVTKAVEKRLTARRVADRDAGRIEIPHVPKIGDNPGQLGRAEFERRHDRAW